MLFTWKAFISLSQRKHYVNRLINHPIVVTKVLTPKATKKNESKCSNPKSWRWTFYKEAHRKNRRPLHVNCKTFTDVKKSSKLTAVLQMCAI